MQQYRTTRFTHRTPDGTYITVYRSREPVIDCWTAVLKSNDWDASTTPGLYSMLGMSENAVSFSQFTEGNEGPHLGKKIPWKEVPTVIKQHILSRISE